MRLRLHSVSFAILLCAGISGSAAATTPAVAPLPALESITFASGSEKGSGFLALPKAPGRRPAMVVIQEWWGVDAWIKEMTAKLAAEGYVTLAVDLYRGKVTADPQEAHELMRGVPEDRALRDLRGALDALAARPDVDPERIGVIGWCFGGGWSLALATDDPRIDAAVVNYGRLVTDKAALARINGAVLGIFGAKDRGIPVADVKAFGEALTASGKTAQVKIYEEAGHGFMNPGSESYRAADAADAWKRTLGFFETHLVPQKAGKEPAVRKTKKTTKTEKTK